ncbi:MAG: hypothetical protein HY862_16330 [Chloroflexi bacterium]|nr:hypothetical protein [Chloroflexota bacterium]
MKKKIFCSLWLTILVQLLPIYSRAEVNAQEFSPMSTISVSAPVANVRWSPEFSWLASSNYNDSLISIWDVANGELVTSLGISHESEVQALEWSPNGEFIASLYGNYRFQIWRVNERWGSLLNFRLDTFLKQDLYTSYLTSLAWSPDSRRIALTVDYHLIIWDLASGFTYNSQNEFSAVEAAWSPDGREIAIMLPDGSTRIIDGSSFKMLTTLSRPEIVPIRMVYDPTDRIIAWSSDSTKFAYFGNDFAAKTSTIVILNILDASSWILANFAANNLREIAWSPIDAFLASAGTNSTVHVWDTNTRENIAIFEAHTDIVTSLDWSPDGKYLVSSSLDGTIRIRNIG